MRTSIAFIFLGLVACGDPAEPVETASADSTDTEGGETEVAMAAGVRLREASEVPVAAGDWQTMAMEEKQAFMATEVMPFMRALFREYDAEEFANFGCADCHGPTMAERNFEMPNPDLYPLHPSGSPEQQAMVQEHPRMVRFMFNHVVPNMRTMIGEAEFDADTGEGFSCYFCHPHAEGTEPASEPVARR